MRGLLFGLLLLAFVVALPDLGSGFRAEDYLAFDHYLRSSFTDCWTQTHLDIAMVSFYRPIGDSVTWALVRFPGVDPWAVHLVLALLHGATVLATFRAARAWGVSVTAAAMAALLLVAQPYVVTCILYLDGGTPQILLGLLVALSLQFAARQRRGLGGPFPLWLLALTITQTFDAGLVWPIALSAFLAIMPAPVRDQEVPAPLRSVVLGLLAAVVPLALLLRWLATGVLLGGYGVPMTPTTIVVLLQGLGSALGRWFVPVYAELSFPGSTVVGTVLPILLLGLLVAGLVSHRKDWRPLRRAAGFGFLGLSLLVPASADILLAEGSGGVALPLQAYRWYGSLVAGALLLGCLGEGVAGPWRGAARVSIAGVVVLWLAAGQPLRRETAEAGEVADRIVADLTEVAANEARPLFLFGAPMSVPQGVRPVARCFQYGLSGACRPPFVDPEVPVYPVIPAADGATARIAGDYISTTETLHRLAVHGWIRALQYDAHSQRVIDVPPLDASVLPAPGRLRLANLDERLPIETNPAETQAGAVVVGPHGEFELRVSGEAPGTLVLVLFNRVQRFFAAEMPHGKLFLRRTPGAGTFDGLQGAALQFLEVARRFPGDLSFALLEARGEDGVIVSNVLPVRLQERSE